MTAVVRFWTLFAAILVSLSLGAGSMAHALEPAICIEESGAYRTIDAPPPNETPKSDSALHAHSGCHGHHLATPDFSSLSEDMLQSSSLRSAPHADVLTATDPEQSIRPPIA